MKCQYLGMVGVFDADHVNYWSNFSRSNNLMVIMNISLIFSDGYGGKGLFLNLLLTNFPGGALISTALGRRLWYYWTFLVVERIGLYYLLASVVHQVQH